MATARKGNICLFILYGLILWIHAATWVNVKERLKTVSSSNKYTRKRTSTSVTLRDVVEIGDGQSLIENDEARTIEGTKVTRYRETFKGIPVYDAYATVELDQTTGEYTGQSSGNILDKIASSLPNVRPRIDETEALMISIESLNITSIDAIHKRKIELQIYANATDAFLVYEVCLTIDDQGIISRPDFFIDANTGSILRKINKLETAYKFTSVGGNVKTGKYTYGQKLPYLQLKKKGDMCILRNSDVRILDLKTKDDPEKRQQAYQFNCKNGFNDTVNGGFSPLTDAFFFADQVVRMFSEWSNVDLIEHKPLDIWVHYGENKVAALFDGAELVFGDGNSVTWFPLVSLDIFAHEMAHVFTDDHSNLEYEGQSGGISESYSDIIGEAAEFYVFNITDFHAGDDAYVKNNFGARDLCQQNRDGKSITDAKSFKIGMNVHYSSGVFNKAACAMFKSPTVGLKRTFQIFTHANRFYWHETSDFADGACGVVKAAYDLGIDIESVAQAFKDVGIEVCKIENFVRSIWDKAEVKNLSAIRGEDIAYRIDLSEQAQPYVRIKISGGTGDVDMFLGTTFPMDSKSFFKNSTMNGNNERLRVLTKQCKQTDCYLYLVPKMDDFRNVTLKVLYPVK